MNRFFNKMADALGTNTAIILFILIAFVPLYYQTPRTVLEWQAWVSQICLQLVLLAVIQKGTQNESRRNYRLLKETHDTVMREMAELRLICSAEGIDDGKA